MKKDIKTLKKKLWTLFSRYIRQRDGRCFTCGVIKDYKDLDAGHYHDKSVSNPELYFSEINVNAQCTSCNLYKSGNKDMYAYHLVQKYGSYILESLMQLKNKPVKWTAEDYEQKIKYYKDKL